MTVKAWNDDPRLSAEVAEHPYPLLFATVSGAHLYGFPSPDSDFDLRGIHALPMEECLGLCCCGFGESRRGHQASRG